MSMFQKSVINKYLSSIDQSQIDTAFQTFKSNYSSAKIKQIKHMKEEEYQDGFLRDLFVKSLGYTLKPDENFNLVREFKNQTDGKKADGAILKDGNAIAVIELKSTKTKELKSITEQAFNYKNNQPECKYVITSNFQKLRFYIDHSNEYIEFNLFNMSKEQFEVLYLVLSKEGIFADTPLKIKKETIYQEDNISKQFYTDYSSFKNKLFEDLVKNNPKYNKLTLFKKSQKLIDRFLFILFAEDRGLLPPNLINSIIQRYKILEEQDFKQPLYDIYKQFFGYLNTGHKSKKPNENIPAYNGGLFYPDEILDRIIINDETLIEDLQKLSSYDFNTEVDVNILGHIFEHSLAKIENITAELEGISPNKAKSKRKKDGVFYTPKYITQYIVDNTIGRLCSEKRNELELTDIEIDEKCYLKSGKLSEKGKKLYSKIEKYKSWLLTLKIIDPACGSGAFLNQALNFLIDEHKFIIDLETDLNKGQISLFNIETAVLENNLYGVDINEESVEIAKLSLWLRTAQKGRKLSVLNNNIKCGNSLIDDKELARDKSFNWEKEFPEVFSQGGFDVVIGNPPYVRQELLNEFKSYFEKNYLVFEGTSDLFAYFYEKSFILLKKNGKFGFISNTFDKTKAAIKLRNYLASNVNILKYIDFTEVQIFEGATTYPIILIAEKKTPINTVFKYSKITRQKKTNFIDINRTRKAKVSQSSLSSENWAFHSINALKVLTKLKTHKTIREQFGKCFRGIVTGFNEAFIINEKTKQELEASHFSSTELIKPFYEGKDILKWNAPKINKHVIFTRRGTNIDKYPAVKKHLEQYQERLTPKKSPEIKIGRKAGPYKWFEIQDSVEYYQYFEQPKITWANLQANNKFCFDSHGYYINAPSVILPSNSKTLLCILNSKVTWFFLQSICVVRSGGYIEVKPQYFEKIPIPPVQNEEVFEEKANLILTNTVSKQKIQSTVLNLINSKFDILKFTKKIQNWQELEFKEFYKELKKMKIKLTLSEETEWMEYFNEQHEKSRQLTIEIQKAENDINQLTYELYKLSEDEIKVVENSLQ